MPRFQRGLHPVISTKNVVDLSGILAAGTDTILLSLAITSDTATLAVASSVERGSTINSLFLEVYFITEGGEVANEVPLADFYVLKNPGNNFIGFDTTNLPTPGATGTQDNKRFVFHEEKGLVGGGDASLSGVPMVFKGVLRIPKVYRKMNANDRIILCARANFATKFCIKCIYKWFH